MTKRLLALFFCWALTIHAPAAVITGGTGVNLAAPGPIGGTTPDSGAFTTLSSTGNTTLGDATSDTVTFTGRISGNTTWGTDNTHDIGASGANRPRNLFLGTDITIGGGATVGQAQLIRWAGAAIMSAQSTTGITLKDASNADFGRLNFGGTTSSFPALKRSGADIEVIKADDTSTDTGIILSSPDGNRWRVTVSNAGAFVATDLDP